VFGVCFESFDSSSGAAFSVLAGDGFESAGDLRGEPRQRGGEESGGRVKLGGRQRSAAAFCGGKIWGPAGRYPRGGFEGRVSRDVFAVFRGEHDSVGA